MLHGQYCNQGTWPLPAPLITGRCVAHPLLFTEDGFQCVWIHTKLIYGFRQETPSCQPPACCAALLFKATNIYSWVVQSSPTKSGQCCTCTWPCNTWTTTVHNYMYIAAWSVQCSGRSTANTGNNMHATMWHHRVCLPHHFIGIGHIGRDFGDDCITID